MCQKGREQVGGGDQVEECGWKAACYLVSVPLDLLMTKAPIMDRIHHQGQALNEKNGQNK